MPPRCFLGCSGAVHLHVFPNPNKFPEQFKQWVEAVGGQLNTPENYSFFRMKRLCDRHFTDKDRNRNNRLNALAIPSLFLKGNPANQLATTLICVTKTEVPSIDTPLLQAPLLTGSFTELSAPEMSTEQDIDLKKPLLENSKILENSTGIADRVSTYADNNSIFPCSTADLLQTTRDKSSVESATMHQAKPFPQTTLSTDEDVTGASTACTSTNIVVNVSIDDISPKTSVLKDENETGASTACTSSTGTNFLVNTSIDDTSPKTSVLKDAGMHMRDTFLEHNYSKINHKSNAIPLCQRPGPFLSLTKYKMEQRQLKNMKNQINALRKRCLTFKSRLESATKISNESAFQKITKNMTSPAKLMTRMQFGETVKKPSGRRFSLEEKILSLSLYKRSPKCYSLLSHCFTLPSKKTLKVLLAQIKLAPGINDKIFSQIKNTVSEMSKEDRLCNLIFDEMSLTPQICYDMVNDKLKGFVSPQTNNNENQIANHVLVFMVKGIKNKMKQPVAYYFTNSLTKLKLKQIIVEVIEKVQETGLIVISSVCDQCKVNVGAISELVQESKTEYLKKGKMWREDFYTVKNQKIIPLYDVPHLLKGLRNNLLTKDLIFKDIEDGNTEKIVKWKYFQDVYEADKTFGELRLLNKITEAHINKIKIKKMRVKTAAQIFSHSVAVVTEHLTARGVLHEDCRNLIPLVSLIDKLFDSLNSSTFHIPNGKIYKGCIRKKSPHHQLWTKAKIFLKSVKFLSLKKKKNKCQLVAGTVPSTTNFVKTIKGFESLWKILSEKFKFDCMLTRNFNQDPIENFFGNIRSCGARNVSPNAVAFEGAFKTLLLNNFNSPHSVNANCEKDENKCLQTLEFFITENEKSAEDIPKDAIELNEEIFQDSEMEEDLGQRNYVCGWVVSKCLKNVVKGCVTCKQTLITKTDNIHNDFIKTKEYSKKKKWLIYPSEEIVIFFYEIQRNTVLFLKKNVQKTSLKQNIKWICNTFTDFPCGCAQHKEQLKEYFLNTSINLLINSWCRTINRILSGKITYEGNDDTKNAAQVYYDKHKKCKVNK